MGVQYVTVEEAIPRAGLRMVVVSNVPSPWGEAAKEIFRLKGLDYVAVRLVYDDEALARWAGQLSGPVVMYDQEPPRSGWAEILMLAERLAPSPPLLSLEPNARGRALELARDFCGENGLGWTRRQQVVHASLTLNAGFNAQVAGYLAQKYAYDPARADTYGPRVRELLGRFATALRAAGGEYYHGATFGAVDIYSAAFMGMFMPLPAAICAMHPRARAAFEWMDDETRAALDPILIAHRDMMYARHQETPLSL
jgi:glutathione S-transferase